MRKTQVRMKLIFIRKCILLVYILVSISCTPSGEKNLKKALSESQKGNHSASLDLLKKIVVQYPHEEVGLEASREAARISFFLEKDYEKAVDFYKEIIFRSHDQEEIINAQKQIILIYIDHLSDHEKSISEINKLMPMLNDSKEKTDYKMKLIRAYYYKNDFKQAENEVDEFLNTNPNSDQRFEMYLLKGNINLAKKNLVKAADIYKKMIVDFPEKSIKENIGLTLSVCYEEMKDFKSAIETLKTFRNSHPVPEYIDIRISRLEERIKNQPGARGRIRK